MAATEQVLTIAAWPRSRAAWRSSGSAARVTRTMPSTFTSSTRCHSASSLSSTVPAAPMPALFTTMSSRPRARPASATAARTAASSVTSARTG